MSNIRILWVDDEIELLKSQVMFLEQKGYAVETASNGQDAIEKCRENGYDIVFLDEQMPGRSGLETLSEIKTGQPTLPVVMVTKSEEENLMEEAIGAKITDYLIKPVNPNQVLLTVKKILDNKQLVTEKSTMAYQQEFRQIGMALEDAHSWDEWLAIYRKLIHWELELEDTDDASVSEILQTQKQEANTAFSKHIRKHYFDMLAQCTEEELVMSPNLFRHHVFPYFDNDGPLFFILIDNLRYDQWKVLQPIISEHLQFEEEQAMCSILPTTTQYSRNAIFAGMMPDAIEKTFPRLWKNDEAEGGKNLHEADFLAHQLKQHASGASHSYHKITNKAGAQELLKNFNNLLNKKCNVIVYNFVDMLSHARTEMEIIKELAGDEAAYRDLTRSWFLHSPLLELLRKLSDTQATVIFGTDHGTIRVKEPIRVKGDRNTTTNLRYKHGKNLDYDKEAVLAVRAPAEAQLPRPHVSSAYVFATGEKFFVYPNNYHYYVNFFRNTFQHGGISLEEMIVPLARYRT